ncbi:hypothetical protein [Serratia inhibens]|uniref:hypothetical protein n=1 Tax=Serratia inhibens TaxID=2338073 RepID=UPI0008098C43|nr:hypothetical protein [Serratia inhibens]ANS44748.1 hypothetical protein Q5A_021635 [Serratia inhibens PRI-2C]
MSAKYILITTYSLKDGVTVNDLKKSSRVQGSKNFYLSEEASSNELIELRAYSSFASISSDESTLESDFSIFSTWLSGDIRRELIKFVEAPIDSKDELPATEFIQLRHVEVPPENYNKYRKWREETIFEVVRENKNKIVSFGAYHSLISGYPGVMFVSAFNGDKASYLEAFTNSRYQKIVKDAGDNYIAGGDGGLYTRIYRAVNFN